MSIVNKIILDHEEYFKMKLLQATLLLKTETSAWVKIRGNLSAKYKFTIDLDTFSESLGDGIIVLPSRPALWQKSSSLVELFVRYDCEHEQDAAVREMLLLGLTERNRVEFYPSLTISYISHRFASFVPPNVLGIIRIKTDNMTEDEIKSIINIWDTVYKLAQNHIPYDGYHSFLEKQ